MTQTEQWAIQRVIVNISSGSAKQAAAGMSVYCASKAALNMFTLCIQLEGYTSIQVWLTPICRQRQGTKKDSPYRLFLGKLKNKVL
ncbi:SDR family NAD(P)-dependent oxidoreductase [Paenibacillus sp. MCAF20]